MAKIYRGQRDRDGDENEVTVNFRNLPWRLEVRNHSPTGLEWGYSGSGPAQLALAIMCDYFGPEGIGRARDVYMQFKFEVIAGIKTDSWMITEEQITLWLRGDKITV